MLLWGERGESKKEKVKRVKSITRSHEIRTDGACLEGSCGWEQPQPGAATSLA